MCLWRGGLRFSGSDFDAGFMVGSFPENSLLFGRHDKFFLSVCSLNQQFSHFPFRVWIPFQNCIFFLVPLAEQDWLQWLAYLTGRLHSAQQENICPKRTIRSFWFLFGQIVLKLQACPAGYKPFPSMTIGYMSWRICFEPVWRVGFSGPLLHDSVFFLRRTRITPSLPCRFLWFTHVSCATWDLSLHKHPTSHIERHWEETTSSVPQESGCCAAFMPTSFQVCLNPNRLDKTKKKKIVFSFFSTFKKKSMTGLWYRIRKGLSSGQVRQ